MKEYTVQKLAKLAGVSVRTLHHYDQIGLLQPSSRSAAGYRYYTEKELLRLQHILFFKELDFPLEQIGQILDNPDFEPVKALRSHRRLIEQKVERLSLLLVTIDKTIQKLKGKKAMSTDEELYQGFSPEEKAQFAQYADEARKKYDPNLVDEVNKRVSKWSKEKWNVVTKEGDDILRQLATLRSKPVSDIAVQALVARHHAYIANFFVASAEVYKGLGQLYVQDARFRKNFDKYGAGFVEYLQKAIEYYCDSKLSRGEG
jgi:DNA-binding transcriptional MerR regulator